MKRVKSSCNCEKTIIIGGYPGGSVNINEVVEEAAKRELLEETGIVANALELFGVFSGKEL